MAEQYAYYVVLQLYLDSRLDVLVVCSSAGWTDQKHTLYLSLLEESFVSQLQGGEISFKGLFNRSPRASRPKQSSKGSIKNTEADQGYLGVVEVDRATSWIKVEQIRSPSCENQEDGKVQTMDDNASVTESQEASSHARATSSEQSSTCHFGKHRHSPSRSAEKKCLVCLTRIYYKNEPDFYKRTTRAFPQEGLDQNFVDEEAKEKGESRRRCSRKRLKSADSMMDDQVVPSVKAELQQVGCLNAREKDTDDRDGSSEVDVGLLDAEPGSSSCKGHGPKE